MSNNSLHNLRWATREENEDDKRRHGTGGFVGEYNPKHKLTKEQVIDIRTALVYRRSGDIRRLATKYGVAADNIINANNGTNWAWLEDPEPLKALKAEAAELHTFVDENHFALNKAEIKEISTLLNSYRFGDYVKLAARYGVHSSTISLLHKRLKACKDH